MAEPRNLRPRGSDDLGLRRALSDRLLPLLVASMVFLAALAAAGAFAAAGLAAHWRGGPAAVLTVQVPQPDAPAAATSGNRADAVAALLNAAPGLRADRLRSQDVAALLKPWLGEEASRLSITLPAVFEVHTTARDAQTATALMAPLQARILAAAPGALVERNEVWFDRLAALAGSLEACAALALVLVAFVATAVVAVATRAGLAARRDAIEIVHGLGATDGMIAGRFAGRVTLLVFAGAAVGMLLAIPLLLGLASLIAPFQPGLAPPPGGAHLLGALPPKLWAVLPALPIAASLVGWVTAQATVRSWLGSLP